MAGFYTLGCTLFLAIYLDLRECAAETAAAIEIRRAANVTAAPGPETWQPVIITDWVKYDGDSEGCDEDEFFKPPEGCQDCKTYEDVCSADIECCSDAYLTCKKYNEGGTLKKCVCGQFSMMWDEETKQCVVDLNTQFKFMTAAQIALGCALIISVAALAALTCKMCAHRRRMEEVVRYHRDSGHGSMNSVQMFVRGRMRDRPPRYDDVPDKPPEYETMSEIATLPMPRIPVAASRIGRPSGRAQTQNAAENSEMPAAPPAYDDTETLSQISILSTDENQGQSSSGSINNGPEENQQQTDLDSNGQDNPSFVPDSPDCDCHM